MLTKEQFGQLYSKGLTVEQISAFEQGKTPEDIQRESRMAAQDDNLAASFIRGVAQPFLKVGASLRSIPEIAMAQSNEEVDVARSREYDFGRLGKATPLQSPRGAIAAGLEIGSTIAPAGAAKSVVQQGLKGLVTQGVKSGAKFGLVTGLPLGLGEGLSDPNAGVAEIIAKTGAGALLGGAGGGVLGAAIPIVAKAITSPVTKMISNRILPKTQARISQIENDMLTARQKIASEYEKVFPLTPNQKAGEQELLRRKGDNVFTTLAKHDINAGSDTALQQLNDVNEVFSNAINLAQKEEKALFDIGATRQDAMQQIERRLNSEVARDSAKAKINAEIDAVLRESKGVISKTDDGRILVPSEVMERLRKIGNELTPFNASDPQKIGRSAGYSLADAVRNQVEQRGTFPSYREASREWSKIIHAQEVMQDLIESGKTWRLPGMFGGLSGSVMRKVLSGALGFHTGGLGGAVLAEMGSEMAAKVVSNPEFRTLLDRKLIEAGYNVIGKKNVPEIVSKLVKEIEKEVSERAGRLALPPGVPRMPAPATSFEVLPAQKQVIRNPKTGRFETSYLSTPKMDATKTDTITPSRNVPSKVNINRNSN